MTARRKATFSEFRLPACFAALSILLSASGCTPITYEIYRPVQYSNVDIAYVADGVDFTRYRRLLAEEMGIFYPADAPASEADLQKVRSAFQQAFRSRISAYELVDGPAEDVLKVRASLIDLRHTAANGLPNIADDLNRILEPGKLTFAIEMRDSVSDRLLLRAADTQESPDMDLPDDGSMSDDVQAAAEYWAELLRNFLDQNLSAAGS